MTLQKSQKKPEIFYSFPFSLCFRDSPAQQLQLEYSISELKLAFELERFEVILLDIGESREKQEQLSRLPQIYTWSFSCYIQNISSFYNIDH